MARKGEQPCETLQELLDDERIELHEAPRPGKNHGGGRSKLFCPECGGGKQREKNFYVRIDDDGQGFTWVCHRANNCGITGGRRLSGSPPRRQQAPKVYRRPVPPEDIDRPASLLTWFAKFGISEATVQMLGIYRSQRFMPAIDKAGKQIDGAGRMRPVIAYPYREDGALLNVKYKAVYSSGVKRFSQEPDAEQSLYNVDSFVSDETGIIVEGEDDVAACVEAGFRQTTSLPDGSPAKLSKVYDPVTDDDQRYICLHSNQKLKRLKQIILAGDMDLAGSNHHEEIARRLGKERCWLVRWPEGCKDAKDTLSKRGRDAVRFAIDHAEPYPLEGIEVVTDEEVGNLYDGIGRGRFITGVAALDQRISLADDGRFWVTTGIPGHGKSAFWTAYSTMVTEHAIDQMQVNQFARPFHTIMFSAEVSNKRVSVDLISQRTQQPFFSNAHLERMDRATALMTNQEWVHKYWSFIAWPERGKPAPLTWLKETTRSAVKRTGAKLVIWDPWQEIDDEMPQGWRKTQTDWLGVVLQGCVGLAVELRTNIVLIVHPHTMREKNKDGSYPVPVGYDIGGGQNFYSRCDFGLTIHRPNFENSDMLVRSWKSKESYYVTVGDTMMRYNLSNTRITPQLVSVDALREPVGQSWQDRYDD